MFVVVLRLHALRNPPNHRPRRHAANRASTQTPAVPAAPQAQKLPPIEKHSGHLDVGGSQDLLRRMRQRRGGRFAARRLAELDDVGSGVGAAVQEISHRSLRPSRLRTIRRTKSEIFANRRSRRAARACDDFAGRSGGQFVGRRARDRFRARASGNGGRTDPAGSGRARDRREPCVHRARQTEQRSARKRRHQSRGGQLVEGSVHHRRRPRPGSQEVV